MRAGTLPKYLWTVGITGKLGLNIFPNFEQCGDMISVCKRWLQLHVENPYWESEKGMQAVGAKVRPVVPRGGPS